MFYLVAKIVAVKAVRTILCLLLCVFYTMPSYARKEGQLYIDSLLRELPKATDDSNKVMLLQILSNEFRKVDPNEGIRYGEEALALAEQLGWKQGIASAYSALGYNYQYKSEYPRALEYFLKTLKADQEAGNKKGAASAMQSIANVYQYQKNYAKVQEYHLNALKVFQELKDKHGIASAEGNLGIFYFSQGDYDKALEYDYKSLQIAEELNAVDNIALNLGNIGNVYLYKKDYARALQCCFKSLRIFQTLGDNYGAAIDLGNIGEIYLGIAQDTLISVPPDSLVPAGRVANLKKAIGYLEQSIVASRKISQLDNIIEFSQYLSDAYKLSGDYKSALESYVLYSQTNDSVYSTQNSQKIKLLENKQALDIKDRDLQIARLAVAKERNERVFFIAGIIALLVVIVVVLRNYNTQKRSNVLLTGEKKRSDDLLLNILPQEVANELKEKGTAAARYFDNVTVLFTDFVNFTQAGEKMSPQQLIDELHTCFKAFDDIIDKYRIEKIKTIGDAYLAVSGLPVAQEMHAENVVKAAIEINVFMQRRHEQLGDKTFDIRIGIHSGSVVAGIVGVKKFAYDIWGDTVNTAARMEQNSEPGKINISQTTYELVKDKFTFTYRGQIQAKNKGGMSMYFVE
ncbi:MAG: hypothetical protein JWQ38_2879 [Flavipsychrobacter sp.]|nr:hypothetical protein [Flavipsychrobacter sp.]